MTTGRARKQTFKIGAVAVAAVLIGAPSGDFAWAQDAGAPAVSDVMTFNIPAQSLTQALTAFAKVSGVRLAYHAELTKGRKSQPLQGGYTREQALAKLLEGTPLTYRFTGHRTVAIVDRSADNSFAQSVSLDTIDVSGQSVNGYVANTNTSATKTNTPLIETPQSISVITREQIEAQGVKSISQSLGYTAGVVAEPRGNVNGYFEFPYIRGFTPANFLYRDGLQLLGASAGVQVEPYSLERIEVVKGPSSILYGQGSPSGIVNLVSKRPTATPFREIAVQGGSWDRKQVMFDLSGPVPQDARFMYRLTGLARDSDTQVDFTKDNKVLIAPAFTWKPDADTSLTILLEYQKADAGFFNFVPAQGTFKPNPNGTISTSFFTGDPNLQRSTVMNASVGYQFERRFNDVFTVRQNYRHMRLEVDADTIFTSGATFADPAMRTVSRFANLNRDNNDADTIDNQLQAKFNVNSVAHTVLAGVDIQRNVQDKVSGNRATTAINLFNPVYYQNIAPAAPSSYTNQVLGQIGGYIQDQVKWDRWVLVVGARTDFATTDTRNKLTNGLTKQADSAVTKRAGLLYLFDNGVAPYVNYSESFSPTAGVDRFGAAFKPTTGRQYEGGIKYQPKDFNALFTVAVFDIARQNVTTLDPVNPAFSVQTGEVASRGFEFEGKMSLAQGLDLAAAYTFLDTRVTKSNGTDLGKRPVGIPDHAASLWLDYTFRNGPATGFGAGAGVRFVGSTWGDSINTLEVPSYTLMDASIHYDLAGLNPQLKGYKLAVNATNLLDSTYVASCLTAMQCFYGFRRTVLGTLKYQW